MIRKTRCYICEQEITAGGWSRLEKMKAAHLAKVHPDTILQDDEIKKKITALEHEHIWPLKSQLRHFR